ncbi:MAG: ABC transporter ATP-binding protein [Gammaproteobacteria bacterium]|nr:ABC transporter ATP-binding protein [Gammaproteobacteria bacterium]
MIRELLAVIPVSEPAGRRLRANLAGLAAESILMGVGFALLVPLLRAALESDFDRAWVWLGAMAGVLVAYALVRWQTQLLGFHAAIGAARGLFGRLGDHIARLPLGWFDGTRVGSLGRLTSQGVIDVMGVPAHLLRPVVNAFVTPATVIAVMFIFDWRLALAAAITAPLGWLVYRWSAGLVQRTDHRSHDAAVEASGRLIEFAQAQAVLRGFGYATRSFSQLDDALREQRDAARAQLLTAAPGLAGFILVVQLAFTILILFGLNMALGGDIDVAELLAVLALAVRYVQPMVEAADLGGALRISRNSLSRMDALLATPTLPEPATSAVPAGATIAFGSVDFAYDDRPVLRNVSFTAPGRTMTAIVGPSGAGKTTILRLIARFWDTGSGTVRIGGVDVRDLSTEVLMRQISVVFQDVYLFDGTIEENIRLGRPDATDAEVRAAATLARVDEIAERLPEGWEARVGEAGARLSGGERQRVSIARAILKDAPIVLLDEATAALDAINERSVQQALRALTADKTLVVVAHRLQTVQAADQIIVLEEGQVVEQGDHAELLERNGRYAEFWNERVRAAGWRLAAAG